MPTYDELRAFIKDYKSCMGIAHLQLASELFHLSDSIEDRSVRLEIHTLLDQYTKQVGLMNKKLDEKFQLDK